MKIGFIGLGAMGGGMARSLLRNGFALRVFDRAPALLARFDRLAQCECASSAQDAAAGVDVLICMLPLTADTRDALLGESGAIGSLRPGSIVMDMGTGNPAEQQALAARLAQNGIVMLDAPVNRAPPEAENGTLLAMVGGEAADVARVMPLLEAMCDTIHHMGAFGTGLKMKLANNYMSMINLLLTAEGIALAESAGINRAQAVAIMSAPGNGASNGQLTTIYPRKVLAGDLTPDFRLAMCLKDLGLALELGASLGVSLSLGSIARNQFALAKSWHRADQDCTAILNLVHEISGHIVDPLTDELARTQSGL